VYPLNHCNAFVYIYVVSFLQVEMLGLTDEIVTVSNEKMRRRFYMDGAVKEFPKGKHMSGTIKVRGH
jgi:hypothetical protein